MMGYLEDVIVTRKHGKNLSDTIGDVLFKDLGMCVEELVANSHDADAEKVDIVYNSVNGTLIIEDNGLGMDKEGLQSFYRLGDSPKVQNPITPRGRKAVGKFGVASVSIKTLARSYLLETWKDGVYSYVREEFGKRNDDAAP